MNRLSQFFLICLCLALLNISVAAQDEDTEPNYLLEMMATAPGNGSFGGDIPFQYTDYNAIQIRRFVQVTFPSYSLYKLVEDTEIGALWRQNTQRLVTGPGFLPYFRQLENMPQVMGFDFFDIERVLFVGQPPTELTILGNDFRPDDVIKAHENRDFVLSDLEGIPLLCGTDGCENGNKVDLANRDLVNIFGGEFGRKQPVLVTEDYLYTSPSFDVIEDTAKAVAGAGFSLADNPLYRTLAEAITDPAEYDGVLAQAMFLNGLAFIAPDYSVFESWEDFTEKMGDNIILNMLPVPEWADYGILPQYSFAVLADRQEGTDQVAIVAVLYNNREDAEIAAAELTKRVASFSAYILYKRPVPVIDEVNEAQVQQGRVYASETTGMYAAVASVVYPLPPTDEVPDLAKMRDYDGPAMFPGQLFRYWGNSIYQRGFYPLWPIEIPDWLREHLREEGSD